jgi:hypothetical protein
MKVEAHIGHDQEDNGDSGGFQHIWCVAPAKRG